MCDQFIAVVICIFVFETVTCLYNSHYVLEFPNLAEKVNNLSDGSSYYSPYYYLAETKQFIYVFHLCGRLSIILSQIGLISDLFFGVSISNAVQSTRSLICGSILICTYWWIFLILCEKLLLLWKNVNYSFLSMYTHI